MALVKCKECGNQVSNKAGKCSFMMNLFFACLFVLLSGYSYFAEAEGFAESNTKISIDEANKQINIVWQGTTKEIRKQLLPEQREWLKKREDSCKTEPNPEDCMVNMTIQRTEELKQQITVINETQQTDFKTKIDNSYTRLSSECLARAFILRMSILAYTAYPNSKEKALNDVINKTSQQNYKKNEGLIFITGMLDYIYNSKPRILAPSEVFEISENVRLQCMNNPEDKISFYIVDLEKAFSKNTDGKFYVENADGGYTVCHAGTCKKEPPHPPTTIGENYEITRKKIIDIGWKPSPALMKPVLIATGRIHGSGKKFDTDEDYGNCLVENSICDKSKPELSDCTEDVGCTAVWSKNREIYYYLVQKGIVKSTGHVPATFKY